MVYYSLFNNLNVYPAAAKNAVVELVNLCQFPHVSEPHKESDMCVHSHYIVMCTKIIVLLTN